MARLKLPISLVLATQLFLVSCTHRDASFTPEDLAKPEITPRAQRVKGPDFRLETADGMHETLSAYKGRIAVINFWATWCAPCRQEIPYLVELHKNAAFEGVRFLGISVDVDDWEEVKPFAAVLKINYPVVMATQAVVEAYAREGLPTTVFIDDEGKVAATYLGLRDEKVYKLTLQHLVEEIHK